MSRMVRELIAGHDMVGLPGVGTFVAELMPASFSDKGYTINPPYRRLTFRQEQLEDSLLADLYARTNGIDREISYEYLSRFLSELSDVLRERKSVTFTGLGRLRATRENNFFFVPDSDLDIFPEGAGLSAVSLRTHAEAEYAPIEISVPAPVIRPNRREEAQTVALPVIAVEDEAAAAAEETGGVPAAAEIAAEEPEAAVNPDAAEAEEAGAVPETAAEPVPEQGGAGLYPPLDRRETQQLLSAFGHQDDADAGSAKYRGRTGDACGGSGDDIRKRFRWWIPLLVLIGLATVAFAVFVMLASVAPDFIDSLLYTPEELRIINY